MRIIYKNIMAIWGGPQPPDIPHIAGQNFIVANAAAV